MATTVKKNDERKSKMTRKISVRFDEETMDKVEKLSSESKMKTSDVVRSLVDSALTGHDKIPKVIVELSEDELKFLHELKNDMAKIYSELNKIGSNVNVSCRNINATLKQGGTPEPNFFTSENLKELDEMKRLMVQIGENVNDIVNKRD